MDFAKRAIGFLVALLVMLIVGVAWFQHSPHSLKEILFAVFFAVPIFGAVTTTYLYPTNNGPLAGGNVAPTQAQMGPPQARKFNTVIATTVASAAGDTSAVITHNLQLTNSEISQGFPRVILNPLSDTFGTSAIWFQASQNPNFTILQKGTLGTGPTSGVEVQIAGPHTIDR